MGSMLGRAERQTAEHDPLRRDLREIGEMAQSTLNTVRSLSQTLHPSILEELGLESTIEWYVTTVKKQLGIDITYERSGTPLPVDATVGIHVYRILQEAVNNVAKHASTDRAWVRLRYLPRALELEVEDHGRGIDVTASRRGLGVIAMRERAELVSGTLTFLRPDAGGTLVRVLVPLEDADGDGR
jgi:signal transduction histidine kinase